MRFRFFITLTFPLLVVALGCRDSAKRPTPASAAPTQSPLKPQPVETAIRVEPPTTIGGEKLPPGAKHEFLVSGKIANFLLVRVQDVNKGIESEYSITVRPSAPGSSPLKPVREGGRCCSSWMYELPATEEYSITFDPAGFRHGIEFSLLPNQNPVVDAGITAEQISIDFHGFADKDRLEFFPYANGDDCDVDDLHAPSHLGVDNGQFEFRVMPIEGLRRLWRARDNLERLESTLHQHVTKVDGTNLPYPWRQDAAALMTTRQEILKGDGWQGLRWVSGYAQDGDYPYTLGYVFEGISDDDQYFILVRADLDHPEHQNELPKVEKANAAGAPIDTEMRLGLEKLLAAAPPDSFQPNLSELDAVILSLKLRK